MINSSSLDFNKKNNDFLISRIIKFQPWLFINDTYENYVYFDYRVKLSKKFISDCDNIKSPCFLKHREGGFLRDEIIRIICRDKESCSNLIKYLKFFKNFDRINITENGVMVLTKKLSNSIKEMSPWFHKIKRDQILTPLFLSNHKTNYFNYTLDNKLCFNVRPKKLNFLNYIKLFYNEIVFTFIRYWKK
tara:strand:- start:168 stop:737 length:570 start_codon:yes stop_codon:yes gene_type:complete